MLTIETETRLRSLLQEIIRSEREAELIRRKLREDEDFDAYMAFVQLDIKQRNYLTAHDILIFFQ